MIDPKTKRITVPVTKPQRKWVGSADLADSNAYLTPQHKGEHMITTLNKIRAHSPCESGWKKLLTNLGKTKADDEPLAISTILESNGLDDALWCLRAVDGHEREMRLFAVECARSVQHLMTDPRSIATIDVADRFANGLATAAELAAARAAAWAARDAAGDAAREAARAAAWAAGDAAWAARDAAGDAARAAAWAAGDAAWAARDAAREAAGDAARGAAWAARDAAREAAGDAQTNLLALLCAGAFDLNEENT